MQIIKNDEVGGSSINSCISIITLIQIEGSFKIAYFRLIKGKEYRPSLALNTRKYLPAVRLSMEMVVTCPSTGIFICLTCNTLPDSSMSWQRTFPWILWNLRFICSFEGLGYNSIVPETKNIGIGFPIVLAPPIKSIETHKEKSK